MNEPTWVLREVILAYHDFLLAQHGGASGLRNETMFDSAISRPVNLRAYGRPNYFELAAAYAFGLVKNHPFVDGNKRIGYAVAILFLEVNGHCFHASEPDAVRRTLALAAGEMTELAFAVWLQANTTPPTTSPQM